MPFRPEQFQSLFDVLPFAGVLGGALTAAAGAETSATITVTGAIPGDIVIAGMIEDSESGSLTYNVNNADLVEFTLANATGGTITIAAPQVRGVVLRLKETS